MMNGLPFPMIALFIAAAIVLAASMVAILFLLRSAPTSVRSITELARDRRGLLALPETGNVSGELLEEKDAYDTIFILPDISNYTSFMTGSRFSTGHAQHIIFCLINAMIDAATRTVELSKLEGDAALFYADARWHSPETIGRTVIDIFTAFFRERERLAASNICNCHACRSIGRLDLKAFVHRGQATRFTFRGSVDHFGEDVIVIHRIMKNGVASRRYVIVTEAATDCVDLPGDLKTYPVQEEVEHFGQVQATVYEIDDGRVAEMARQDPEIPPSVLKSTMGKLGENLRTLRDAVKRKPNSTGS